MALSNDAIVHNGNRLIYNFFHLLLSRHIPKAKATTIAETPEMKRIAENTRLQSNANYHADFEKAKGKLTQVRINRKKFFTELEINFSICNEGC